MQTEEVVIVNGHDQIIGSMPRFELRQKGLIYRVTYILVFNSEGKLLVQKRTDTKDQYPGLLDFAAGGVITVGESYEQSAVRELKEELGVEADLTAHGDVYFEDIRSEPVNRNWGRIFACIHEGPFVLQQEEVASAEFMDVDDALSLNEALITPDTRQVLISYLL